MAKRSLNGDLTEIKVGIAVIQEQMKELHSKISIIAETEKECKKTVHSKINDNFLKIDKLERNSLVWDTKGKVIWGAVVIVGGIIITIGTSLAWSIISSGL